MLYVVDGQVLTSAGTAAAIDLSLHLVRLDHGAEVANAIARRMVVPAHRDGGQAQFVEAPLRPTWRGSDDLAAALDWAVAHLDQPLTVSDLAGGPGCRPARSPAASVTPSVRPRCSGSSRSGSCWLSACWRRRPFRWTWSPNAAGWGQPPTSGCTSAAASGVAPSDYRQTFRCAAG